MRRRLLVRARERARVEKYASRTLGLVAPHITRRLHVIWCRRLPEGDAWHTHACVDADVPWMFIDEYVFEMSTPDEREDTIRHELAHLIAYDRHGRDVSDHGPEFQRARRDLERAIEEEHA
jgi:hypothetical protein